jgi:hypothetical protein
MPAMRPLERQRYETEWEGFRLVADARPDHWQAFVYDIGNCEVLDTSEWPTLEGAKLAALESVALRAFGPKHGLNLRTIMQMLLWQPGSGPWP